MSDQAIVAGWTDPAFAACFDAFSENIADGELGAACAIYRHGQPIMDVWGGIACNATSAAWRRETLVPAFSVTKGVAAICVLLLVDRGLLALDAPVARYWPEFAAHEKGQVTVREALAHRAGVPVLSGKISMADLADSAQMACRLAGEPPLFEPGTAHFYHAITVGWITGELVRRVTGQTIGAFLRTEVSTPLHLDLWIGHPRDGQAHIAVVEVPGEWGAVELAPESLSARAISLNGLFRPSLAGLADAMNNPAVQAVELAGANGLFDARSLARLYAAVGGTLGERRLIAEATLSDACAVTSSGKMWGEPDPGPSWGAGLMLPFRLQPMLGSGSFGHDGAGGSLAFAHPPSGISFAYLRNRMGAPGASDLLVYRVVGALARSIGLNVPPL